MNRRDFLTASSSSLLLGSAGCLGNCDGTDRSSYEEVDLDCEGLSFGQSSLPLRLGDPGSDRRAAFAIDTVDSVPEDAVVIDALAEDLDEHEHLVELLRVAGCSDERAEERSEYQIAEYHLPHDEAMDIRDLIGTSREAEDGWYVGYDADIYRLEIILGDA
jgi:hypothetical protein